MILYQHCCLSALCISLATFSPSSSHALVFFTTPTLIRLPSLPLAPFPLLLSCPPNPLLQCSPAPTLPFPRSLLLSVVDLAYTRSWGRVGFKEKACLKQQIFSFFFFFSFLLLGASVGGPACAFPPSCRDQAPHALGWGSPGSAGAFKRTLGVGWLGSLSRSKG